MLKPDASSTVPGVGHTLYAVKDSKLIPVRFHSAKLPQQCLKWSPCEVEALSLALAIDSEYNLLRESRLPILILADNKAVVEAAEKIKQEKYSSSSRMNRFLANINKIPISVRHLSGK